MGHTAAHGYRGSDGNEHYPAHVWRIGAMRGHGQSSHYGELATG
jgi:hypothetical protein